MFSVFELLEQVSTSLAESKSQKPKTKAGQAKQTEELIVFLGRSFGSSRNFSISRFDELSDEVHARSEEQAECRAGVKRTIGSRRRRNLD